VTSQEKFEHWLDIAEYDLETAKAMLNSSRWLYVVFMCQQAIEKLVKGLYVLYIDDDVPRTHNIRALIEMFEDKLPEKVAEENYTLFEDLSAYYLNGRYADYKQKLSRLLNETQANNYYQKAKGAFSWLLTMKP